jgi:hypothetical protein
LAFLVCSLAASDFALAQNGWDGEPYIIESISEIISAVTNAMRSEMQGERLFVIPPWFKRNKPTT